MVGALPGAVANPLDTAGGVVGSVMGGAAALTDAALIPDSRGGHMVQQAAANLRAMDATQWNVASGELALGLVGGSAAAKVALRGVPGVVGAAESGSTVVWNNGWRTLDGKFASPLGTGRAGGGAEVGVWDAIAAKPGWSVRTGNVAVRDASGQLRYYDGIAISPRDRVSGLEVKSGTSTLTAPQRIFDSTLNSKANNVAIGVGQSRGITVQRSILIKATGQ
ncbi:hypothetical protein FHR22_001660 [Sphingopyxis panaciterrae]|uniref:hypothetical protein n=1 Tax=Sphingopyxis panaciterrae TaxID=363841 RepID=UPI00142257CC|nr:hypothetical protein [Sphingopyxis panaciterrae]NIJ36976.1 hypothetical protein [Sphingopyxis panaciterrae]